MSAPNPFAAACLRQATSFPTDPDSGTPWGAETLVLDLPGGPYRFTDLDARQRAALEPQLGRHQLPVETEASVVTRLVRHPREAFLDFERVDWKILIDLDPHPSHLHLAAHQWLASIHFTPTTHGVLRTPLTEGAAFTDLFENYFRVLVAYRLLLEGGLLVHSAAAVDAGRSFLFPGASGDGKSTISRIHLREGREVLSDDGNALLPGPDGGPPLVRGLPFGGELRHHPGPREAFPLAGLFALSKGVNGVEPLSQAQATALLLRSTPFVNGDPHRRERLFAAIESMLEGVPCRRLSFRKDGGFWPLVMETLELAS